MYEKFYGLRERAFNLTPDPQFLFLTRRSKEALEHVLYGIERREGFALITGDVGTGKTTLCWAILDRLQNKNVSTAIVQNPLLSDTDMLRAILQDLGVRPKAKGNNEGDDMEVFDSDWTRGMDRKQLIDRLNLFLAERAQADAFTVLIIDESQNLSLEMLEQMRLLSNLETAKRKLLQIIFVGQLELAKKLKLPGLRQLEQRISIRYETKTLSRDETEKYIRHRLATAGGATKVKFGRGCLDAIFKASKGYPRLINLICDRALLAGYSQRSYVITRAMVHKAVNSLHGTEDVALLGGRVWLKVAATVAAVALIATLAILLGRKIIAPTNASPITTSAAAVPIKAEAKVEEAPKPIESPAPPAPVPVIEPAPPSPGYRVQVHSFEFESQANAARRELERAGFPAFVEEYTNPSGEKWQVVYAGPFEDRDAATNASAELKSKGFRPVLRLR